MGKRRYMADNVCIFEDDHDEEQFRPKKGQVVHLRYKEYVVQDVQRTEGELHVTVLKLAKG